MSDPIEDELQRILGAYRLLALSGQPVPVETAELMRSLFLSGIKFVLGRLAATIPDGDVAEGQEIACFERFFNEWQLLQEKLMAHDDAVVTELLKRVREGRQGH